MISRNHFLLIFINDLPLLLVYCLFADDAKTIAEIKPKLQHDCITSKAWAEQNKMHMHYDKASCMIVGTRHRTRKSPNLNIMMDNNKTKQVHYQKLLGIYFDVIYSGQHIGYICDIIFSKISLLKQLSYYIPVEILKIFYQSYILPLIDYGSNAWGTTSKQNIERLWKLQKRAAHILLSADYLTSSAQMFIEFRWPLIRNRHNYIKAVLTYKR